MAGKKYKSFEDFADDLKKQILEVASRKVLNKLAERARDIIYKRVKSGFGVNPGNRTKQRLKRLSPGYVAFRAGNFSHEKKSKGTKTTVNKGAPKLGAFGAPSKSNVTLTGETLENIAIKFRGSGLLLYFPDSPHPVHKRVTIAELAKYVEQQGRPFFYLTEDERQILVADLSREVRRIVGALK